MRASPAEAGVGETCRVPDLVHNPVMVTEVLAALEPRSGGYYFDGTVGGGGHAAAILRASAPSGWLFGCDRDSQALEEAARQLAPFAGRFELQQTEFAGVAGWLKPGTCEGALLDLGVSSFQLDSPQRGFSLLRDGPLDMRMDARQGATAAELLNTASVSELSRIFWELGGEPQARRIAQALDRERAVRPLVSTVQLAEAIARVIPRLGRRIHPATRVFQALRMEVNDELGNLRRGLEAVWRVLKVGGRLAVIAFHSGEERIVKAFGRGLCLDYTVMGEVDIPELRQPCRARARWQERKALAPSSAEIEANPRSRSAHLRVLEKIYESETGE